jgi:thioredoxin-like negative regulator of GroEL
MALPNAPKPNPVPENPMVSHARMVREGRAAFANGEYGRAADWFQRAIAVAPVVADGHLLLAQAWIALGKYVDVAAEIHRGVQLDRTWPLMGPPIRELYGPRQADFERHLQQLADAAAAFPNDAALQFALAYVRWFDGQRIAAHQIFESLRTRVANPDVIDLFLGTP